MFAPALEGETERRKRGGGGHRGMELGLQGSAAFALGIHTTSPATPSQETATAAGHGERSSWRSAGAKARTHTSVHLCPCVCVSIPGHGQGESLNRIL